MSVSLPQRDRVDQVGTVRVLRYLVALLAACSPPLLWLLVTISISGVIGEVTGFVFADQPGGMELVVNVSGALSLLLFTGIPLLLRYAARTARPHRWPSLRELHPALKRRLPALWSDWVPLLGIFTFVVLMLPVPGVSPPPVQPRALVTGMVASVLGAALCLGVLLRRRARRSGPEQELPDAANTAAATLRAVDAPAPAASSYPRVGLTVLGSAVLCTLFTLSTSFAVAGGITGLVAPSSETVVYAAMCLVMLLIAAACGAGLRWLNRRSRHDQRRWLEHTAPRLAARLAGARVVFSAVLLPIIGLAAMTLIVDVEDGSPETQGAKAGLITMAAIIGLVCARVLYRRVRTAIRAGSDR